MRSYLYEKEGDLYTNVNELSKINTLEELLEVANGITLVIQKDGVTSFRRIKLEMVYDDFGLPGERHGVTYTQNASNYKNYKNEGLYSTIEFVSTDFRSAILNALYEIFGDSDIPAGFYIYEENETFQKVLKACGMK